MSVLEMLNRLISRGGAWGVIGLIASDNYLIVVTVNFSTNCLPGFINYVFEERDLACSSHLTRLIRLIPNEILAGCIHICWIVFSLIFGTVFILICHISF